jgi:hypothetical protein
LHKKTDLIPKTSNEECGTELGKEPSDCVQRSTPNGLLQHSIYEEPDPPTPTLALISSYIGNKRVYHRFSQLQYMDETHEPRLLQQLLDTKLKDYFRILVVLQVRSICKSEVGWNWVR